MKLYQANDRADLYHNIYTYKKRREKLRQKYDVYNGGKAPIIYKQKVYNINQKIRHWQKMITTIDRNNNRIIAIANALAYFTGYNVKDSVLYTSHRHKETRNLFYKYCLEHNISATLVAEYVGASRGDVVARGRSNFTLSFEKHPKNRETYNRFLTYMNELSENQL